MAKIELIRFLSDSAGDALNKAQDAKPETAKVLLDEADRHEHHLHEQQPGDHHLHELSQVRLGVVVGGLRTRTAFTRTTS